MTEERINIYEAGEYQYEAAYGFEPNIHTYIHEDEEKRPLLLVVPGGGYCMVCGHEGEVVAREFYEKGMNAAVLTYTTDITMSVPLHKQPLKDISRAVRVLRANSDRLKIKDQKVIICGFSAGGHVCATLCTHFDDVEEKNPKYKNISNRPDASMLCYPVITSGEFTHIYSMWALMGRDAEQEEKDYFSCEKNITKNTPPSFIWQTVEDDLVPVENSYLYAQGLRKAKVPYAHYVFPVGGHGMSIANEALARGTYPGDYTYEQLGKTLEHIKNRTALHVSEERYAELDAQFFGNSTSDSQNSSDEEKQELTEKTEEKGYEPAVPDVSMWAELAWFFLKQVVF